MTPQLAATLAPDFRPGPRWGVAFVAVAACFALAAASHTAPGFAVLRDVRGGLARAKAVLRRGPIQDEGPTGQRLEIDGLVIDKAKYQVSLKGMELPLTLTEFKLISTLASAPGRVFTRQLLLEKIQAERDRAASTARQAAEKVRRRNRPPSRRAKLRMLETKSRRAERKSLRRAPAE